MFQTLFVDSQIFLAVHPFASPMPQGRCWRTVEVVRIPLPGLVVLSLEEDPTILRL